MKTGKDVKIKPVKIKGEEGLVAAKEEALAKESWMKRQKDKMSKLYNGGKGKVDRALKNKWIQKGFLKANGKISKRKLLAWAAVIGVSYYVLKKWLGEPAESEEMKPEWYSVKNIPFDTMWPDAKFWVPHMVEGKLIKGAFTFGEGDVILEQEVNSVDSL